MSSNYEITFADSFNVHIVMAEKKQVCGTNKLTILNFFPITLPVIGFLRSLELMRRLVNSESRGLIVSTVSCHFLTAVAFAKESRAYAHRA